MRFRSLGFTWGTEGSCSSIEKDALIQDSATLLYQSSHHALCRPPRMSESKRRTKMQPEKTVNPILLNYGTHHKHLLKLWTFWSVHKGPTNLPLPPDYNNNNNNYKGDDDDDNNKNQRMTHNFKPHKWMKYMCVQCMLQM